MQSLHTAKRLAVLACRSGELVHGSLVSGIKDQCRFRLAQSLGCSGLDGLTDVIVGVRSFAAEAGSPAPNEGTEGSDKKQNVNTNAKVRHNRQQQEAKQSLKAGAAPETAAAAPAQEQPQNPAAAQHQGEVLQNLQAKVDSDSKAGNTQAAGQQPKRNRWQKDRNRKQRQKEKAKAAAGDDKAESISASASAPAGPTASGTAASSPASQSSAPDSEQPHSAEPLPWRLQQKQWQAAQPAKAETASSPHTDLLQSSPAQGVRNQRPGFQQQFQGRKGGPGSPVRGKPTPAPPSVPQPAAPSPEEIKKQEEEMESFVRGLLYSEKSAAKDLTQQDVNRYYQLDARLMPEAFADFYQGTLLEKGGCKGLQDEMSHTRTSLVQYRDSIRRLHLKAESRSHQHLYLEGPRGCGKSIALASLVDWARSQGWLVLYVPSARALIEGGLFNKGDDGLWETPEIAKVLLRSMVTNHEKDMEKLTTSSGETLLKVVEDGLSASKPGLVTGAAARLVTEMANIDQMPVMIAVDEYNVLYSHANYHEWVNEVYRRQLQPHELRLASTLRILEQQAPKNGMYVGAASHAGPVSPKLQVPCPKGARHTIPKLDLDEATQQLCHYTAQGKSSSAPELYALQSAYYATDGNAKELRRWQRRLTEAPPSTLMASMQSQGARWGKQLPEEAEESDALPSQQTVLAGRQHMQQELTYAQQSAGL